MRRPHLSVILFLLIIVVCSGRQSFSADCRPFSHLVQNGSYAIADANGRRLSSCNEKIPFIPASIIKIPLALAAFDILGKDFRFITEFYMDTQSNLYIKGHGDPFLISEEVDLIIDQLIARGMKTVNRIFIDNTSYDLNSQVPGRGMSDNPYDVPVTPSAVNFNTVKIKVRGNGSVVSAEPQTPTMPLMQELGKLLPSGEYRINICQDGCEPEGQSARYMAELFRSLMRKKGVQGKGDVAIRKVPEGIPCFYAHKNSKHLEEIIFSFLKFSNNFVANQVFLHCGIAKYGLPASWEKARTAVNESLSRLLGPEASRQIYIEEGSGLSRNNRITAISMLRVLEKFKPYVSLMQEKKDVSLKSGTLTGVYNYAGYFPDGRQFVILLNQEANTRDNIINTLKNRQIRR